MKPASRLGIVVAVIALSALSCDNPSGITDPGAQIVWLAPPPATLREGASATIGVELRDGGGQPLLTFDGATLSLRFTSTLDTGLASACGPACTTTVAHGRAQLTVAWVSAGSWTATACLRPAVPADSLCVDSPITVQPVQAALVTFPADSVDRRVRFSVEARLRLPDGTPVTDLVPAVRLRFASAAPAAGHVTCPEAGPLCERVATAGVVRLDSVMVLDTATTTLEACVVAPNGTERCDPAGPRAFRVVVPPMTLYFLTSPGSGSVGVPFTTQPVVEAREPDGTLRADFTGLVDLTLSAGGTLGQTLAGTDTSGLTARGAVTVRAAGGRATMADLRVNQAGAGYTLVASAAGAVPGTSATFDAALDPAQIAVVAHNGNNQYALPGTALPMAPDVRVTGPLGDPLSGVVVGFAVTGGGGNVVAATDTTGVNGIASPGTWQLGAVTGPQTLAATVSNVAPALFTADGIVPATAVFVTQPGSAVAGDTLRPGVVVEVHDARGRRVFGATDSVAIADPLGVLFGTRVRSTTDGRATFDDLSLQTARTHTLNLRLLANYDLQLSQPFDVTPRTDVVFLHAVAGNGQSGFPAMAVDTSPTVRMIDIYHNHVPGQSVTFTATFGGGTVTGAVQVTDTFGIARPDAWVLGAIPGFNTLSATADAAADVIVFFANSTAPTFNTGSISAGFDFTCATANTTNLPYCWGDNAFSQLGEGTQTARAIPTLLSGGLLPLTQVSAGAHFACGLAANGAAYCWGANDWGQLGIDSADLSQHATPDLVVGGHAFQQIATGFAHACALDTGGIVWCWGAPSNGSVGPVTAIPFHPLQLVSPHTFTQVAAGGLTSCALTDTGDIWCWGGNGYGQLGDGSVVGQSFDPVRVAGGHVWSQVSVGFQHVCGVSVGSVYCWGRNQSGQLGIGSTSPGWSLVPVPALGVLGVTRQVAAGTLHTCAVTGADDVYCWGDNASGQLGDFTTTARSSAVQVVTTSSFVDISAGSLHTCARTGGGATYCWGSNGSGRLGDGTQTQRPIPVQVLTP